MEGRRVRDRRADRPAPGRGPQPLTAAYLAAVEAERAGTRPLHEQLAASAAALTECAKHLTGDERDQALTQASRFAQLAGTETT